MTRYHTNPRAVEIQAVLKTAVKEDLEWLGHGRIPGKKPDPVHNPWMPFQMSEFVAMLAECLVESEGNEFLDIGSGIGTKIMIAEDLFGLDAWGIETDKVMREYAVSNSRWTELWDALRCTSYNTPDILWLYRPFKDTFRQAQLEHKIFEDMKPGAVIAGANWENKPTGFEIVLEDLDDSGLIRGAWKKPLNWEPVTYDLKLPG